MKRFAKVLSKDFYNDAMMTLGWNMAYDDTKKEYVYDRDSFKSKVLFPFLYGTMPSWSKSTTKKERKTMMHYFIEKFPGIYCVLWRMRRFTEILLDFNRRISNNEPYRTVMKHIKKTYETSSFPLEMQRLEADMIYDIIAPQIQQPFVTLHDSIIVQAGKKCNVSEIIKEAFKNKYDFKVCVKCEMWH